MDWVAVSPFMLSFAIHRQIRRMGADHQARQRRQGGGGVLVPAQLSRRAGLFPAVLGTGAAVFALTVTLLVGAYNYHGAVFTLPAQVRSYRLSDGSLMQLNGASIARPQVHPGGRSVTLLRGEVFFDVKHDPVHPFAVRVGSTIVRAVGTTFLVSLLAANATVTVQEGRIRA
jgi:transmembrane sensor